MWARVLVARVMELRVPRMPELRPVWSVRQGVKIGPSVDSPVLPAAPNPHGFGHSECGARWGCDVLQPRHLSRMRPRRAPLSRFLADQEKSGAYGTGSWMDTQPQNGCCRATFGRRIGRVVSAAVRQGEVGRQDLGSGASRCPLMAIADR
jgi:hypothetical protein